MYKKQNNRLISFKYLLLIFLINTSNILFGDVYIISGNVYDKSTGKPISQANIVVGNKGTYTNDFGYFSISVSEPRIIKVVRIGYVTKEIEYSGNTLEIYLENNSINISPIEVTANRVVSGITPVAYSSLSLEEIEKHNSTEDLPMILSTEPGVHAYSESGNGTGYSYVSIRGFDQSRISVMIDNVPLNDNESHQVYWVDHGDILTDASEVEIQRGIGNSLYGSAAFGGSINVQTRIKSPIEKLSFTGSYGSYDTYKGSVKYFSGERFNNISFTTRLSSISSNGYRQDSKSDQTAFSFGAEHSSDKMTNQFRAFVGKEISILQWDGISGEMLNDRKLRRHKMDWTEPFKDDFLQQIYSLNTRYSINTNISISNVAYLVNGSGYYEVNKFGQDYYFYNLDVNNEFSDEQELELVADFTRRKWIHNTYYGIVPTLTINKKNVRLDLGIEARDYIGDHYGEVLHIYDPELRSKLPSTYRYYDYTGEKQSFSSFIHLLYSTPFGLHIVGDLQYQTHKWSLDQKVIGHAYGHQLSANWEFINPRFGITYDLNKNISLFANYGTAQKEPADDQIIEADDVWSEPKEVAAEKINDKEMGINISFKNIYFKLNGYRIDYFNEVLSDIYDFAEGEFDVETADKTRHEGIEIEGGLRFSNRFSLRYNGSFSRNRFTEGEYNGKTLSNVPGTLANITLDYNSNRKFGAFLYTKYVGKQYIDFANTEDLAIDPYFLVNLSGWIQFHQVKLTARINNLFDTLYATYGYEGGYYWPGATRNYSLSLQFNIK